MAGSSTSTAAKKAAAEKASPVGTREDPMAAAHPLVGVAGVAEQVAPGPRTAEEQKQAIGKEYGEYVATSAITHDGALAYNVGDAVPASNVAQWKYDELGLVKRRSTKAAQAAIEESIPAGDPTNPEAPVD